MIRIILLTIALASAMTVDEEVVEKQKLEFVENNLFDIFSKATVPEMYNASADRLTRCGCSMSASNIMWGRVGMQCKITDIATFERNVGECSLRCFSPKSQEIMLMCPQGFHADCERGCIAPEDFTHVAQRIAFLEGAVDMVVKYGFDYLSIDPDYLDSCGCTGSIRAINYGTRVGLDCLYEEDRVDVDECTAFNGCIDSMNNMVAVFCPAGHLSTCQGCVKQVYTAEVEKSGDAALMRRSKLDWMTLVLSNWIQESWAILGLEPSHRQVMACGCSDQLRPITYGNRVGYYCTVDDPTVVTAECGPNLFCENEDGDLLFHLCPSGYTPNCSDGCGFAWDVKDEL